ncbi:hypothetical protein TNCV_1153731 [Trichonephila clavipes]|nr:hypothetical protein TNCV_1153731 [Trichonephila clavipes]
MRTKFAWKLNTGGSGQADHQIATPAHAPQRPRTLCFEPKMLSNHFKTEVKVPIYQLSHLEQHVIPKNHDFSPKVDTHLIHLGKRVRISDPRLEMWEKGKED